MPSIPGLDLFFRFAVALFIGLLVGLQREYAFTDPDKELFGGVRTFAIMGLIGASAALITDQLNSPWPFAIVVLVLGFFLAITYYIDASRGAVGLTTEVSAVITILAGALAYWNMLVLAVALGVATTGLLSIKVETQRLARRMTREDLYGALKFALIAAIVLPLLPNQDFGPPPFDVFNPYRIWLLVVFISGISFVGYVLIKVIGPRRGIGLLGFLGGLASSTAVTLSLTQRSRRDQPFLAQPLALAILIAWTVMFSRVLIEVAVVNASLLRLLWVPILGPVAVGLAYSVYLYFSQRPEEEEEISFANPFSLSPAIKFGLLFTLVLFISRAAQVFFGNAGIYASSVLTGLADVDAIALSVSQLTLEPGSLEPLIAARAIVFAAVANTFAKGGIVLLSGAPALRRVILPGYLLMMLTGILLALFI